MQANRLPDGKMSTPAISDSSRVWGLCSPPTREENLIEGKASPISTELEAGHVVRHNAIISEIVTCSVPERDGQHGSRSDKKNLSYTQLAPASDLKLLWHRKYR